MTATKAYDNGDEWGALAQYILVAEQVGLHGTVSAKGMWFLPSIHQLASNLQTLTGVPPRTWTGL